MSKRGKSKSPKDAQLSNQAVQPKPANSQKSVRNWLGWSAICAFAVSAALLYYLPGQPAPAQPSTASAFVPRNLCKAPPPLIRGLSAELGFGPQSALSTSERDVVGLAVVDFDPKTGKRAHIWQHPSWRNAGNLSAFALDKRGDVYVIPAPRVNLSDNPPALQNRLYRVDGASGVMTLALEFPIFAPVSGRNPFAGLGLSYDCTLDSLFLTSVAGSTPASQNGQIFRIRIFPSVQIASTLSGIDAFAVLSAGIENSQSSALLLGSARTGEIVQLSLDNAGNFPSASSAKHLLSIAGLGPEGNDRARKIELSLDGTLSIRGVRFAYNLAQPAAQAHATQYIFRFDAGTGQYQFQRWQK
jgi:hypothetical protein